MAPSGEVSADHADILCKILEVATEGNWDDVRDRLIETGYEPDEIIAAWKAVADIARVDCGISEDDF